MLIDAKSGISGAGRRPAPAHYEEFQRGLDRLHVAVLDYRTPTARDVAAAWTRLHRAELMAICAGMAAGFLAARDGGEVV